MVDITQPAAPADDARLLVSRRFLPLFLVQALGAFNDNVFKNAFVSLLTYKLIDELQLEMSIATLSAIAAGVFILPFALFAPVAGQIADRYDKALMMRVVKFVEIILMIAAAAAYFIQDIFILYILLFLMGAQSAFFSPIKYGVLPQYVRDHELVRANGMIQAATFLAILLGTIIGFNLILHAAGVLWTSIAVVVIAVVGFVASLYAPPARPIAKPSELLPNFGARIWPADARARIGAMGFVGVGAALAIAAWTLIPSDSLFGDSRWLIATLAFALFASLHLLWPSIADSVAAAKRNPIAWRTILAISWFWFLGALCIALLPSLVKEELSGDESVATLLLTAFSVGVAIGAMLAGRLARGPVRVGAAPWGAVGIGLFSIDLYFSVSAAALPAGDALRSLSDVLAEPQGWRVFLDFVGLAISAGLFVTPLNAVYQHAAPEDARGRVVACSNMIDSAAMTLSSVAVLALEAAFDLAAHEIIALLGASGLVTALLVARWAPETMLGRAALSLLPSPPSAPRPR